MIGKKKESEVTVPLLAVALNNLLVEKGIITGEEITAQIEKEREKAKKR